MATHPGPRSNALAHALAALLAGALGIGCSQALPLPPEDETSPALRPVEPEPRVVAGAGAIDDAGEGEPGAVAPPVAEPRAGSAGAPAPISPPNAPPDGFAVPTLFTDGERALIGTLSPLPPLPPDATNAVADDPRAAQLGRALFEDPEFSGPLLVDSELGAVGDTGRVSCATCHFGPALADPAAVSTGTGVGTRNALSLVNSSFHRWSNWGGRFSAQWELSIPVVENPKIMNGSRLRVAHRIADAHRDAYEEVFGALPEVLLDPSDLPADGKPKPAPTMAVPEPADGAWEMLSAEQQAIVNTVLVNYGKAIAAFLRTLVSRDSPFDRFVAGESAALDLHQQAGLRLFIGKARCITCHNGPLLSDGAFHAMGVPATDPALVDLGRYQDIPPLLASPFSSAGAFSDDPDSGRLLGLTNPPPEETRAQFRTASLRTAAQSPPYMHNGVFAELEDVVQFYDWGGQGEADVAHDPQLVPLHLTDLERSQLVAFLRSLAGEPLDSSLTTDTRPAW